MFHRLLALSSTSTARCQSCLHLTKCIPSDIRFCHACFARLEFALGTLVNPPMGSGVAHIAIPEDECCIGLYHLEGVFALAGLGHCVDTEMEVSLMGVGKVGKED
jgi:hypothetical protein